MTARLFTYRYATLISALVLTVALGAPSAQTVITPDRNKYSPADDVKIGLEAAEQARKELPMLNDPTVDEYIEDLGERLADAIPSNLQHREFRYSFDVVNMQEINAFALPGGPMFLNRGMIEVARSDSEVAGVMAHEIAHIALRHGTAQATKAQPFQIGAIAGQILGAIIGGTAGNVIGAGSQIGLGTYFLKYGREYERQADLLGAQIMARAGYDPRRMADMFRTIERQSRGRGGPEWLSSHPNPGNRYEAIVREAGMLQVRGNAENLRAFNSIKARLDRMSPAYTAEQVARGQVRRGRDRDRDRDTPRRVGRVTVEPPSNRYRTVPVGNFLQVSVPQNWEPIQSGHTMVLAPDGGYDESGDTSSFTHGLQIGVVRNETHTLEQATDELVDSFGRSNPNLRRQGRYRRERLGGRSALSVNFTNVSDVTGEREIVTLSTTQLGDGSLLYLIGVAPQDEINLYEGPFQRAKQTLRIREQTTYR